MGENHKNGNRKEPLSVVLFWLIVVWGSRILFGTYIAYPHGSVTEDSWLGQYFQAPWGWIVFAGSIYIGFIWPCVAPDSPQWAELRSYCPFRKKDKE